ncbi:UDP-N-acetyl-D-mannosamine dehydrogenase [Bradyrhizobium guangzhouense]|uniref:UDP-N-acetyl-D-mannosamine dehydrogenase n=1 Tax=Bradyrhizobium guangzhouense TaxID=1325095 RepID=A0ABY0E010_9BRAD|nr:UDP-N-acetyl-D-mannosamine dehydrogenase [Bradyrhizobium guangzhouense]RXH09187.1 UDP-N-acetyl-D-mannosamine dehydrogenase [Bradyrhizobium guangzhouense]
MRKWTNLSVVGLGYIGLPTAALFAQRGLSVTGVDVNKAVVDSVNKGRIHIVEPDLDGLVQKVVATGALKAVSTPEPSEAFIIAVPTPLGEHNKPDVSFVFDAAKSIAPFLKKDDLVIIESTCPVGTTKQVSGYLADLRPDLTFPHDHGEDSDVLVAYSPERVLPGRILIELIHNDRSVGGLSRRSSEMAGSLYTQIVEGNVLLTSAEAAELVKLTENSFRDVNIAFANELALVCEELKLNCWEIIELANKHPRVSILQPGPGVGGHCIAVDPYFIIDAVPKATPLMQAARAVNEDRPLKVLEYVRNLVGQTQNPTIACLGLSFKPNIDDLRSSPAVKVVELLAKEKLGTLIASEPNVSELPQSLRDLGVDFADALTAIDRASIVVLLVDHRQFDFIDPSALRDKRLVDTRGLWTWRKSRKPQFA